MRLKKLMKTKARVWWMVDGGGWREDREEKVDDGDNNDGDGGHEAKAVAGVGLFKLRALRHSDSVSVPLLL